MRYQRGDRTDLEVLLDRSVDRGSCRVWTGPLRRGYGCFSVKGKMTAAHRISYELFVGPIPDGLVIDHLCRNRACINPAHLEPVTERENILRGEGVAAFKAKQTHCVNGHEFTPENTWLENGRKRRCRTCWILRGQRRRAAEKVAS